MVLTYCLATAPSYLVDINIFNSLFMKCFMKKKPDFETYSNYSDGRSHRINVYCSLAHILCQLRTFSTLLTDSCIWFHFHGRMIR